MARKLIKLNQTKCCGGTKVLVCDSGEHADISACVLRLTWIPCDRIFAYLIILVYAEHELVAIMTVLIHYCSIMKMIPHMAVFRLLCFPLSYRLLCP